MGSFDKGFWDDIDNHWNEGGGEEAEENSYSILPEGEYDVRIVKWDFRESKEKKTPGMNIEFNVVNSEYDSRKLWHTFWLTPANLPYVLRDIRVITGHRISKPSELQDLDLQGLYARVKVKHETYKDKVNARISSFMPISMEAVEGESSGGSGPAF